MGHPNDPKDLDDYNARCTANMKIEGFGLGNVWTTMPCPGCAAPGWLKYELLQVEEALKRGAVCKVCGRGFLGLVQHTPTSVRSELRQTVGPDLPDFLQGLIPRMEQQ